MEHKSDLPTAQELIRAFELSPHPEGGFFKQTYRSSEGILGENLPDRFSGDRAYSTAIYYLLSEGQVSKLHRIKSDEIWHFYLGGSLIVAGIDEAGKPYEVKLGQNIAQGEKLQYVVKAGHWFGAYLAPGSAFSFVGCTVSPGFEYEDFEFGDRAQLLSQFPAASKLIEALT